MLSKSQWILTRRLQPFCPDSSEEYTLTINTTGEGTVTADPEPVEGKYQEGTEVELTAVPADGWEFVNWLVGEAEETDNLSKSQWIRQDGYSRFCPDSSGRVHTYHQHHRRRNSNS
ncbi:hypothetical protein [Mesotoga sp.]|uniref:InlB B-repeat-containing protein n=1 Tax=Mesotoga sp. TaxID=2053577 RepID=UPI00345EC4AA